MDLYFFVSFHHFINLYTNNLFNRGHYVGIHTSSFSDFVLKPELLQAVRDCGFEHPSEGIDF